MTVQQQAKEAEINQKCTIGQCATIIARFWLAAKSQLERLRFGTTAQQIGGIPDRQRTDQEASDGGNARRQWIAEQAAEQLDANRTKPVGQRTLGRHSHAGDIRCQPILQYAMRHGPHDAETGRIIVFPRVAADQAWQDIEQTERNQSPARQSMGRGGSETDGLHQSDLALLGPCSRHCVADSGFKGIGNSAKSWQTASLWCNDW